MELHCDTFQIKYLLHNDIAYQVHIWLFMADKINVMQTKGERMLPASFQSKTLPYFIHVSRAKFILITN